MSSACRHAAYPRLRRFLCRLTASREVTGPRTDVPALITDRVSAAAAVLAQLAGSLLDICEWRRRGAVCEQNKHVLRSEVISVCVWGKYVGVLRQEEDDVLKSAGGF